MEKFERIKKEDAVSATEREAFVEMLQDAELGKKFTPSDPQLRDDIEQLIETLPDERSKEIIRRRFLQGETLEEIGEHFAVGPSRIQQIVAKSIRLLRHPKRMLYIPPVELESRDRDTYSERLHRILQQYPPQFEKNKKVREILHKLDSFTWGDKREKLGQLDSLTFNQICDDLNALISKENFAGKDVITLKTISEKLALEIAKVK
ncbi:MAG: sigma factor-like helix-turn-helix DNA-binding protein [Candidatus Taylorbacteria bacterium]